MMRMDSVCGVSSGNAEVTPLNWQVLGYHPDSRTAHDSQRIYGLGKAPLFKSMFERAQVHPRSLTDIAPEKWWIGSWKTSLFYWGSVTLQGPLGM